MEEVPFRAIIKNSKGGKYPNWVVTIPAAYVKNGLVTPGQEVDVVLRRSPNVELGLLCHNVNFTGFPIFSPMTVPLSI